MDIEEPSISSVNKLLQRRVEKHPDHIIVTVPDREFKYSKYTFSQLDQAVSKLTAHLVVTRPWVSQLPAEKESRAVGFLSKSGFHFAVHELALIRLGWTVLFLSPNNSPPALEYLLRRTRCRKIIVHSQLGDVAAQTQVLLARSSEDVSLESYAESTIWETEEHVASYPPRLSAEEESPNVAFIFHSSGSTGYPKPIFITHAASIHNFANNFDMNGLITLPLYHAHGHSCFFRSLYAVKNICVYPPELPITAKNIIRALKDVHAEIFYAVPFVLKLLGESEAGIDALAHLKLVIIG